MDATTRRLFGKKAANGQADLVPVNIPPLAVQKKNVTFNNDTKNLTNRYYKKSTALNAILNGLKLSDDNSNSADDTPWSQYKKTNTPYDIIIRINSLFDLRSVGWEILLGEHVENMISVDMAPGNNNDENIQSDITRKTTIDVKEGAVVTVLGAYNRGKSFLLNQLCNVALPNGNLVHTEGISITAGKENYTNIVFLDTAGTDTPVKNDDIDCKRATEALLREVVLHLCTFIIVVVNRLRATDQVYIREILKHCQAIKKKAGIIIVHNLLDIETAHDIEETIHNEVEYIFDAIPRQIEPVLNGTTRTIKFFSSKKGDIEVRHFILAKAGSEAAHVWNTQSLDGIMNLFQNSTEHQRSLDIIDSMISFVNSKLPHLFIRNDDLKRDDAEQDLQIVQHDSQPCIVLSERKHRQNLTDQPCLLGLSEKLVYDNAGFFLRHEIDEWEPRYNLYENVDEIRLVLELPGFKKGECETVVRDSTIIINGTRTDLNTLSNDATIHQSDIPSGSFTLHIPLRCEIITHEARSTRDDGFITITAPKKKSSEEKLEI